MLSSSLLGHFHIMCKLTFACLISITFSEIFLYLWCSIEVLLLPSLIHEQTSSFAYELCLLQLRASSLSFLT